MHTYDIDALYASIAKQFWTERERANATGGQNNIRAKGDGPEKAVRDWIAGVVGTKYRVTEGHVVTADGRKSKQMDVIVVWDSVSGTLYGSRSGEPELVRSECVAAVGEVKSSWYDHNEVLRSYSSLVSEIEDLQEGLLVENRARFGEIKDETPIAEMALPVTGRAWMNKSYNFVIALGLGKCELKNLVSDMTAEGIAPVDGSALILDEQFGGAICMPCRGKRDGQNVSGMQCEVYRNADDAEVMNSWTTLEETITGPSIAAGRLLHLFLADLQLHLSTWWWEFRDPRPYVKLSPTMRRRHPNESPENSGI